MFFLYVVAGSGRRLRKPIAGSWPTLRALIDDLPRIAGRRLSHGLKRYCALQEGAEVELRIEYDLAARVVSLRFGLENTWLVDGQEPEEEPDPPGNNWERLRKPAL